jgi:hypothetical protein
VLKLLNAAAQRRLPEQEPIGGASRAAVIRCGYGESKVLQVDGRGSTMKKRLPRVGIMIHRPRRLLSSVGKWNSSGRSSNCYRMLHGDRERRFSGRFACVSRRGPSGVRGELYRRTNLRVTPRAPASTRERHCGFLCDSEPLPMSLGKHQCRRRRSRVRAIAVLAQLELQDNRLRR